MVSLLVLMLAYGPYQATVIDIIAPGVLRLEVSVWPDVTRLVEFRLDNIESPRLTGLCEGEQLLAQEALDYTRSLIGKTVVISRVHKEIAWFSGQLRTPEGVDLGMELINTGYAVLISKSQPPSVHVWCSP
ncbi:MAG TPA: hypothetical protein VMH34_03320 [Gammaproteobacteria bacterium]|nr:hypothetical protein [Gammaproteobacteria bacterium]